MKMIIEALKKLDEVMKKLDNVKIFIKVKGSDHLNMIDWKCGANETRKQKRSDIRSFFRS